MAEEGDRRSTDGKLEELYDYFMGKPGVPGFFSDFRAWQQEVRAGLKVQSDRLEAHELEHKEREEESSELGRDVRKELLAFARQAVTAAITFLVGLYVAVQSGVVGGQHPK